MAAEPKRSLSPWWSLLLLPVALGAGWLIAELPAPPPRAAATAAPAASAAGRPASVPGGGNVAPARAREADDDASGEAELRWMSYSSAMEESRNTGTPILLDFNAEWCPPCRSLKSTVFDDPSQSRKLGAAVIAVSVVDRVREEGRNPAEVDDLQRRYQIEAFPTLIVFSPATGRSDQARGFGGADATVNWILRTAASVR